ncbi:thioredoxin family protein [Aliiglaciecola sp. CAU 1673]|uniref:TlpA family protein disulfide reductase n=1 Tax=Aliiglaciecola sp. CAU 1673 TaxID=3032595 RepID=UPI0023DC2FDA|nr:thioredoxin family protein [Aliiglaciecola sp. CAU 1673]MDF2176699.1 thioredoxin family protein [Aliiglaciecola sp. CAU 1673]
MLRLFVLCFGLMLVTGCATTAEKGSDKVASKRSENLGVMEKQTLLSQYPAFTLEYQNYYPSQADIAAMAALQDKEILVLFGTWCHDSEREVPRLLKLIDESGVNLRKLTLVAVDMDKTEPGNLHLVYGLRFTPTIILIEDGLEVARIVERPNQSIAKDFVDALTQRRVR